MLQLGVAHELGYSLAKLKAEVTLEELLIWSAYYDLRNEEQELAMKKRHK
jgi:hypothetical protein